MSWWRRGRPTAGVTPATDQFDDSEDLTHDWGAPATPVSAAFPKVPVDRGGTEHPTWAEVPATTTTYSGPTDPRESGAGMDVGDLWIDSANGGRVQVWNGTAWVAVVDPAGRGGFWGDGRTGFEDETPEDRWRREAERADGDAIRLGDHWARRTADGWVCEACDGESADAGLLAETGCG